MYTNALDDRRVAIVTGGARALGRPEAVAHLVTWLASEVWNFCTGAVFDISGGRATY